MYFYLSIQYNFSEMLINSNEMSQEQTIVVTAYCFDSWTKEDPERNQIPCKTCPRIGNTTRGLNDNLTNNQNIAIGTNT